MSFHSKPHLNLKNSKRIFFCRKIQNLKNLLKNEKLNPENNEIDKDSPYPSTKCTWFPVHHLCSSVAPHWDFCRAQLLKSPQMLALKSARLSEELVKVTAKMSKPSALLRIFPYFPFTVTLVHLGRSSKKHTASQKSALEESLPLYKTPFS